jgi:hypothetical protein
MCIDKVRFSLNNCTLTVSARETVAPMADARKSTLLSRAPDEQDASF